MLDDRVTVKRVHYSCFSCKTESPTPQKLCGVCNSTMQIFAIERDEKEEQKINEIIKLLKIELGQK